MTPFTELTIIFAVTFIVSLIFRILKQPLIISYIISGLILVTLTRSFFEREILIQVFSKVGIAILLFIIGLELKLKTLREIGLPSIVIGTLQEIITILIGFLLAKLLGFSTIAAFYLGAALSFSSTVIIVKLIADKGDLGKLYGKLAIGFLLVQDLITILIIISLSFFSSQNFPPSFSNFNKLILGSILLILIPYLSQRFFPKLENFLSSSLEFLFLFSLFFLFTIATLFDYLDFGIEIGALLAGVSLSSLVISSEMVSRLKPLRDFFILLFFITLGSQINIINLNSSLLLIIIFSLFVLIGNPLIMFFLLGLLGYQKKTMFLLGLSSAQISEFSFILIKLGIDTKYIEENLLSIVSIVGLVTIFSSTYLFIYADKIYPLVKNFLRLFEKKGQKQREELIEKFYDIILFGCDRIGLSFLNIFLENKLSFLVVDYNIDIVKRLIKEKVDVFYGDASEVDTLKELNLTQTKLVISTIPDFETNLLIFEEYKKANSDGIYIATAYSNQDALDLYKRGIDYVIMPYFLGGEYAANLIAKNMFDKEKYLEFKNRQIEIILQRINLGHQHPVKKTY
jgi:Kef-type K+ transport system membrane component KefB/Trk K+ transport system NAD-binding subunit